MIRVQHEAYKCPLLSLIPIMLRRTIGMQVILGEDGRIDEELSMRIQKALSLDPLSPVINAHNAMLLGEQGI